MDACRDDENNFELKLLSIIKQAQQQHGLRHGDYQRYHQYLSRKLHRMRKSLKFLQGDKRRVSSKIITENHVLSDVRFLHLVIFQCERAWARYHQIQDEMVLSGEDNRKKFHANNRLRKAVTHVLQLNSLVELETVSCKLDAKSKLEIQAYADFMIGLEKFIFRDWYKAKSALESAHQIYIGLINTAKDEPEKALYQWRIDELLPQIRYCAYNVCEKQAVSDLQTLKAQSNDMVEHLLNQARMAEAQSVTEVYWLNDLLIPIRHEKSRIVIIKVQEKQAISRLETTQSNMEEMQRVLESVMESCVEILTTLRDEVSNDATQKFAVPTKLDKIPKIDQMPQHQLLMTYFTYVKHVNTLQRNLLLVAKSLKSKEVKPQEMSRLYDSVVQNLQELSQLSGVCHHIPTLDDLLARIKYYKIQRCFNMARAFMKAKVYKNACALFKRIMDQYYKDCIVDLQNVQSQSEKSLSKNDQTSCIEILIKGNSIPDLMQDLDSIYMNCETEELSCRAANLLVSVPVDEANMSEATMPSVQDLLTKPLEQRLDSYVDDPNFLNKEQQFITLPPDFEPIPAKPFFFNLAANHIRMPSLKEILPQSKSNESKGNKESGFMSWLGWNRK